MLRTTILKLPPDLRIAFALNFLATYHGQGSASRFSSISSSRIRIDGNIPFPRRQYATVHSDDTNEIWTQHGKDPPVNKKPAPEAKDQKDATTAISASSNQSSSESSSISELIAIIERKLHESGRGSEVRDYVKRAFEGPDPLEALRNLAHDPVQSWGDEKRTTLDNSATSANLDSKAELSADNGKEVVQRDGLAVEATLHTQSNGPKTDVKAKSDRDDVAGQTTEAHDNDKVQLLDLQFILETMPLPTREDYPTAPTELFCPPDVAIAVHNGCAQKKKSMHTDVDFKTKEGLSKASILKLAPGLSTLKVCQVTLNIPDLYRGTTIGEGISKKLAKQAAWLHMVSQMHVAGVLKELFLPKPRPQPAEDFSDKKGTKAATETDDMDEEPVDIPDESVEIDESTLIEEKDAKTEIYDYAASFGLVPRFELNVKQRRPWPTHRDRKRKAPPSIYQMIIKLEGRDIQVSATGKTPQRAEIAAAIAFKKQAEKQHETANGGELPVPQPAFACLNVDNAKEFFEFYKRSKRGVNVEVEHEQFQGAVTDNVATLKIDGVKFGETATMRTKAQAESVAYLTAAVRLASTDLQLLQDFADSLKKAPVWLVHPIDLEIDDEALECMRIALIEARKAGLPDSKPVLNAEELFDGRVGGNTWQLSPQAHEIASQQLLAAQQRFDDDPGLESLRSHKAALPMNQHKDAVLAMVEQNQCSIVIGATGSGKSTQLPQILFENAIKSGRGSHCNIVCSQPRRIAATSVARRVATERNEALGQTVGYQVRLDIVRTQEPYGITYFTTGKLLQYFKYDADSILDTASHIILDEVHERDQDVDFLMVLLKKAVKTRQEQGRHVPRIVFMSATLDAELIAEYFSSINSVGAHEPCPSLRVPGRAFPVEEKYLDSIMHDVLTKHGPDATAFLERDPKSREYLKLETAFSDKQNRTDPNTMSEPVIDWKRERQNASTPEGSLSIQSVKEALLVPISLVAITIAHVCSTSTEGVILVFLPGMEEIHAVQRVLLDEAPCGIDFLDRSKFQICLLHSKLPSEQQSEVFRISPVGCRRIILSTNIAETSVTVPDVKYVIDTGKLRERSYDPFRRITQLHHIWESKSNSKQRAGRAGRVQNGFYYALFSRERSLALRDSPVPELLRCELQEIALSIKAQRLGNENVASFLAQAIEPPPRQAVRAAIADLTAMGALTPQEDITSLGRVLSVISLHPNLAKMIVLGLFFRCLDPMIALGTQELGERSLFSAFMDARDDADRAYHAYGGDSQSDHIAFLKAFKELRMIQHESGPEAAGRWAEQKFLQMHGFHNHLQAACVIEDVLEKSGLVARQRTPTWQFGPPEFNENSENYNLVRALILAGLQPNLAMKTTSSGRSLRTRDDRVITHPGSINSEAKKTGVKFDRGALFAHSELRKSSSSATPWLLKSTRISPLMAVLFGGEVRHVGERSLKIDDWLPLNVRFSDAGLATKLIFEFRKALDRMLNNAFDSLSSLGVRRPGDTWTLDENRPGDLVSNPMRDNFIRSVVEVLGHDSREDRRGTSPKVVPSVNRTS